MLTSSTLNDALQTPAAAAPARAAATRPGATAGRRTIDAPTRMFHWLFAASFVGAYATADGEAWRALHVTLGYTMAGLLGFRVVYGLIGPRHARLSALWRKLASAPAWIASLLARVRSPRPAPGINWRQGQNLAMAAAVIALLLLVVPLTFSGYATYNDWGAAFGDEWLEELHEFFGNALLGVVLGHLALITGLSLLRRSNQALPMLNGKVEGRGPDLVKNNHGWLAALLLAAVLVFVGWQWQQAPNGLVPASPWNAAASARDLDHDDD